MHLSPHEQHPVLPWLKTFPKKTVDRVPTYLWPFGCLAFSYAIIKGSCNWDAAEDYEHRF
jgi:hypothetical protein